MQVPQPRNPLHGLSLEHIVTALHLHYGWIELAQRIPLRCFADQPSISSSLKMLRKTPWAREKVESLYLFMLRGGQTRRRLTPVKVQHVCKAGACADDHCTISDRTAAPAPA